MFYALQSLSLKLSDFSDAYGTEAGGCTRQLRKLKKGTKISTFSQVSCFYPCCSGLEPINTVTEKKTLGVRGYSICPV